jgi:hypothetical protein
MLLFRHLLLLWNSLLIGSSFGFVVIEESRGAKTLVQAYATSLRSEDASSSSTTLPLGNLGPPEPLSPLPVGDTLKAFRQSNSSSGKQRQDFTITRLAQDPHMFLLLRNVLSSEECQQLQQQAQQESMEQAETITQGDTKSRTHYRVAWIKINQNDGITQAMARMFLSPNVLSHARSGVEDLQVLEYQQGGEFILHHDGVPRVLTIIYYLNGIAGTWFLLAYGDDKNN